MAAVTFPGAAKVTFGIHVYDAVGDGHVKVSMERWRGLSDRLYLGCDGEIGCPCPLIDWCSNSDMLRKGEQATSTSESTLQSTVEADCQSRQCRRLPPLPFMGSSRMVLLFIIGVSMDGGCLPRAFHTTGRYGTAFPNRYRYFRLSLPSDCHLRWCTPQDERGHRREPGHSLALRLLEPAKTPEELSLDVWVHDNKASDLLVQLEPTRWPGLTGGKVLRIHRIMVAKICISGAVLPVRTV